MRTLHMHAKARTEYEKDCGLPTRRSSPCLDDSQVPGVRTHGQDHPHSSEVSHAHVSPTLNDSMPLASTNITVLRILSFAWFSLISLGAPLALAYLTGVGGNWLAHYCGHCGMRLLLYTTYRRLYFIGDDQLQGIAPDPSTLRREQLLLSPYPPDAVLVQKTDFKHWQQRYNQDEPVVIFSVEMDKPGSRVVELWDMHHKRKLYDATYPDFDVSSVGKFNPVSFGSIERMSWRFHRQITRQRKPLCASLLRKTPRTWAERK